jgi:hypothetical protein
MRLSDNVKSGGKCTLGVENEEETFHLLAHLTAGTKQDYDKKTGENRKKKEG